MRSVYLTQYSALQELFLIFMARWCKKCYNLGSFPKILRQLDENEGNFILTWNSGGKFFQNYSPVEKNEDKMKIILY